MNFIQEAIGLLNQSGYRSIADVRDEDLVGETAVVRPLNIGSLTISYLIGERETHQNAVQSTAFNELVDKLQKSFDDEELKSLCFALTIPYEDLGSKIHSGRAVVLVQYAQRHGRLADLVEYGRQHRSHLTWPHFPKFKPASTLDKSDIAIIISLAQPALEKVSEFLSEENIDANILLITNVPAYDHKQFLTIEQDWNEVAKDFGQTMDVVSRKLSGMNRHFFIAGPMPLMFAMGCIWGTVHTGDKLYHLDRGVQRYVHVLTSSQEWLSD